MEHADIPAWYAFMRLPQATGHTSWNLASADDLRPVVDAFESDAPSSSIGFAIEPADASRLLGAIDLHAISPAHRTAEIGFTLDPACWGQGIATHCCRAVVEWGFASCGFVRIQAVVLESNPGSIRVLEKCGFAYEGLLRQYRIIRGQPRDFRMYARIAG